MNSGLSEPGYRANWQRDKSGMPILEITARGQIKAEHDLLANLEQADAFHVERLDPCRVKITFSTKVSDIESVAKSVLTMSKEDLLDEAARHDVNASPGDHIATLRKKVAAARETVNG